MSIIAGIWIFLEIAHIANNGEPLSIEKTILLNLRHSDNPADPIGPIWIEEAARDITALGSLVVLSMLTVLTTAFLLLTGKKRAALFFLMAIASGAILSSALKEFYGRLRPDLVAHQMNTMTLSFPSGHSLLSTLTYLTIGALLASTQPKRRVKAFILLISISLAILVGLSRLYLGVHWPTDVVAGWCAGAVWALIWWKFARVNLPRKEQEIADLDPSS